MSSLRPLRPRSLPWASTSTGRSAQRSRKLRQCPGRISWRASRAAPHETCAVDPEVIPLGSAVTVDYGDGELRHYRAEDIGGGVKGNRIDICVSSHEEALELGVRTATVYWMEVS